MSRELATIVEGKTWVIKNSKTQSLITRNYHELQEIRDAYEHATNVPKEVKEAFVYKDSDAAKQYIVMKNYGTREETSEDFELNTAVVVSFVAVYSLILYLVFYVNIQPKGA